LDASDNLELRRYYNDRHISLVQPDFEMEQVSPKLVSAQQSGIVQ